MTYIYLHNNISIDFLRKSTDRCEVPRKKRLIDKLKITANLY